MRDAQSSGSDLLSYGRDKAYALNYIQPGPAKQLMHDGLGEAGGVILHAHGPGGFVELKLPHTVDLAHPAQGHHGSLAGHCTVSIQHIKLRHKAILSAWI